MPCRNSRTCPSQGRCFKQREQQGNALKKTRETRNPIQTSQDLSCAPTPLKVFTSDDLSDAQRHEEWPKCCRCLRFFSIHGQHLPKTLPCQHMACASCCNDPDFVHCVECASDVRSCIDNSYRKVFTTNTLVVEWMKVLQEQPAMVTTKVNGDRLMTCYFEEDMNSAATPMASQRDLCLDPFGISMVDGSQTCLDDCLAIRVSKKRISHVNYRGSVYFDEISTSQEHLGKVLDQSVEQLTRPTTHKEDTLVVSKVVHVLV
ncbi:hypothetical protein GUITHDRAFT_118739 [Guillardia theta CCMP2712]|uniref:RING-type domain-containing protein n=1 Tax=Guillardia theta (strain CCMP2712) TaxID=905079 RepID=L1IFR7_GUITC|nr:hypothetical protein GUITHDRAFT_118739 [Guillardia theta CCMP2712]EKX35083.1 hypothetical protein GUITHDRAFT_118739 [Guillardia theta CCMP2712]|eukprot:XP_005822063.1 hypothetical protein GUITHDRAFT_118739 [Guillardia theta CCMP2712]